MTMPWFLAPPIACTRFPCAVPRRIDVVGDVGGADEAHRLDVRVVEDRVDRLLVAVDDVQHARRARPASMHQLGQAHRHARGPARDGLRMKVLPHGDGDAEHPHRDHRREVERGDAGDRRRAAGASNRRRCRGRRPRCIRPSARAGCRRRTRSPRGRAGCRRAQSAITLPCSDDEQRGQLVHVRFDQRA